MLSPLELFISFSAAINAFSPASGGVHCLRFCTKHEETEMASMSQMIIPWKSFIWNASFRRRLYHLPKPQKY